jgi:hypothetical protein
MLAVLVLVFVPLTLAPVPMLVLVANSGRPAL